MSAKRRLLVRDYWCESFRHRPYKTLLHELDDTRCEGYPLKELIEQAGAVDGDEIEITVRVTGDRPVGDLRWHLTAPHTYGPEKRER